jgi:hypothetical protein
LANGGRRPNTHHVTLDEVESEWDFLDPFFHAVHALLGLGEDHVRFLVEPCEHSLLNKRVGAELSGDRERCGTNVTHHDRPAILEHEQYTSWRNERGLRHGE